MILGEVFVANIFRHKVPKTLRKHKEFCCNHRKLFMLNKYYIELRLLKVKRFLLNIVLLLLVMNAWAQKNIPETIVEFKFSNDFVFGTDHYFSNGLQLKVYGNFIANSPVNFVLPGLRKGKNYHAFTIVHNIYTQISKLPRFKGVMCLMPPTCSLVS